MLALFLLCLSWPIGPLGRLLRFSREVAGPLFAPCSVLDLAVLSLLAGAAEEMLFRGTLQAALGDWLNPAAGLVLASLLFGLVHPITPTYVLLAALLGLYLGTVWQATGSLLVVIVAHAVYDFLLLLYLSRFARSQGEHVSPRPQGQAG